MSRTAVCLIAAGLIAVGIADEGDLGLQDTMRFAFAPYEVDGIVVSAENGDITVVSNRRGSVAITAIRHCEGTPQEGLEQLEQALESVSVTDNLSGGILTFETDMPEGHGCAVCFEISVPAATGLQLETGGGSIGVSGMGDDIDAATSAGDIELADNEGAATLATDAGNISVSNHAGSVDAQVSSGSITCDVAELQPDDALSLTTGTGSIDLLLPVDVSARLDATTGIGSVEVQGLGIYYGASTSKEVIGNIGSGESEITLRASEGSIRVRAR